MIGEILDSVLKECQALLSSTGATVILKTNFLPKKTPDNNGNFILLGLDAAPDTTQYPGGLTRCDWKWDFGSYNWEPDAYGDDQSGFSTDLLNFIDRIRQHFSLGALGKGVAMPGDTLKIGVIYQVINGTIVYDGNPLTAGTFFVCVAEAINFTSTNNGYVVGTSWLTQAMVTIFNNYGFQFTLTGITAADALDQDGLIMGFKIGFDSTAFDQVTQFNEDDIIFTTIISNGVMFTQPNNGSGGAITFTFNETNLLQDSNGSWYLPLTLPIGLVVIYASSNQVSITDQFDQTFSPNRLYGFASNDPQNILIKVT
jgi:hypothetical protein